MSRAEQHYLDERSGAMPSSLLRLSHIGPMHQAFVAAALRRNMLTEVPQVLAQE